MTVDDERDPDRRSASPALLDRTMARPRMASATQTFTDLDHKKISEQAARNVSVLDRPSLLWELDHEKPTVQRADERAVVDGDMPAPESRPKYETMGEIGRGGMGDVYEVHDVDLKRTVALKRIRRDMLSPRAIALFLQEAQITAQLEHPNIVPVHDSGRTSTGEAFFTMKRLRGLTLRQVLNGLGNGDAAIVKRFSSMRLGITFLEVVRAVAYAHSRGVVHCDLKPSNVLIGEHNEVVVGDWGLARQDPMTTSSTVVFPEDPVDFKGVISGSIPYMAPEQITSDDIDRRVDVYALGAMLYEILAQQPICAASSHNELLGRVKRGIPSPRERAPFLEISEEIDAICMRCLKLDANERYQSAGELQVAIEEWLTGARRRRAAETAYGEGERAHAKLEALNAERGLLLEDKQSLEQKIKPFDGEVKKQPLWLVEDRLFQIEVERDEAIAAALDAYGRSASLDGSFLPPQDRLADLHLRMFLEAEDKGRVLDERFHRRQVERFHRGRHGAILEGKGIVTLRPLADARITCTKLVEHGKKIVADEVTKLDNVEELVLPMGSYLFDVAPLDAKLRAVKVHVRVGRGTRVDLDVRLFPDDVIGRDFIHVTAGPYLAGGDEVALNSEPRIERALGDFFIAKYSVTCAQYVKFLNALVDEAPHLARQHAPRTRPDGGALWEPGADGKYTLPRFDADGNPVHPDAPVMGVSFFDAEMYAAHLAKITGEPIRLPSEHEWEKAARGADGRLFPWGNGFDPSFCKMALSRPGRPQPEPVGSFPVDDSVYGMRDAAGAIREWTDSFYDSGRETRVLRGGAWYFNPHYCRLAFRHGYLPHVVFTNFGFRLAKSAP